MQRLISKYKCLIEGCENKRTAKELCQTHYDRTKSKFFV